jgi:hypothetical protein
MRRGYGGMRFAFPPYNGATSTRFCRRHPDAVHNDKSHFASDNAEEVAL